MNNLLELKKKMKKKKPLFIRQDAHKKHRLAKKWRRPKGIQSKLRLNKKGHRKKVKVGFRTPKALRHLNQKGLKIVIISSINQIENIDQSKEGVIISGNVGLRKRKQLITNIMGKKITILNIKDPKDYLNKIEAQLKKRQEKKKKKKEIKEKKTKKIKEKEKKKEDKKDLAEKIEEEEDKEKKEKDKLLTKRV